MARLPTVKVVNPDVPGGHMVINESDFDESEHELWADQEAVDAVNLVEVPCGDLAEALAEIEDLSVIQAAAEADDRNCAESKYEARIDELTGSNEGTEG